MVVMKWALIVMLALVISAVIAVIAGQLGMMRGQTPADLGVKQGKLKGLPPTPNCVSSQADLYPSHPQRQYANIAPLTLRGDGLTTIATLAGIVESTGGAKLISRAPDYLYVQYTTPLMKYVDDVEFWFDPSSSVIQVRSASRFGKSDLGTNRKRIEDLRAALAAAP